ncbi:MAG: type II toxin-antitoxin system RelE/ParE family toxin [Bacteroidales bacterium]|nr:type II toxin-antitoxin system RelE/ParE family toxin [Bacteroidales bacterium]
MNLIWDEHSLLQLQSVADYIRGSFGVKRKNVFLREVKDTTILLLSNPYMGVKEPLLQDRSKTYRVVLIHSLSKMAYYVENNTIHIMAFWDVRCNAEDKTHHLL